MGWGGQSSFNELRFLTDQEVVEIKIGLIDVDGHNFPNLSLMKLIE